MPVITTAEDLAEVVESLRQRPGDCEDVEAKSAKEGLPSTLAATLCAFANRPGGGVVILGLDERQHFTPVDLDDPQLLAQQIANVARNRFTPPIVVTVNPDLHFQGKRVVVARVYETPLDQKPCTDNPSGKAYIRAYDGDFTMSPQEIQAFWAARQSPTGDLRPVEGATLADLDEELLSQWRNTARANDPAGLGQFDNEEILRRAGICTVDNVPTIAGLFSLGIYPQQFFPLAIIRAASFDTTDAIRATHDRWISGSIPAMIIGAMDWAQRAFDNAIATREDGHVETRLEYPLPAFRELISNALIHRDYHEWSRGTPISVRHYADRLAISNPGGLYGVSTDQLGARPVSSARNQTLLNICKFLPLNRSYPPINVVEALAQGIPMVNRELSAAHLPPPHFDDTGISFTVLLRSTRYASRDYRKAVDSLTPRQKEVFDAVTQEPVTVPMLAQQLGTSRPNLRRILNELVGRHLISIHTTPGERVISYQRN